MAKVEGIDQATLAAQLDEVFTVHENQLNEIFEDADGDGSGNRDGRDVHPVGTKLAESFGVSYKDVMAMFCSGYGFGEIMHALQTSQETGISSQDLLGIKTEMEGWGQVWQLELIARRSKVRIFSPP